MSFAPCFYYLLLSLHGWCRLVSVCELLTSCCRRPGILVLINDADWELEGEDACVLQPGDNVVFVSTLHGG